MADDKLKAYDNFYTRLNCKNEGKNDIYKLAKGRERKRRDFIESKCLKSEDCIVLVKVE